MGYLRSWMFVPGNHQRRLEKVGGLSSDVIIYDLEDAVPLHEKDKARILVQDSLQIHAGRIQYVRINDPSTTFYLQDVNGIVGKELAGIVLPKVADGKQLHAVDAHLALLEAQRGIKLGATEIMPIIETAAGLYRAYEIATASDRVKRLAFGSVDFTLDIGAIPTSEGLEILYARSQLVAISRAAEIEAPIDAVFTDVKDPAGLSRDARLGRQLGFQGKLVIHPDQITVIHEAFTPTEREIAEARTIAAAFQEALKAGSASIQVNGKLVDYPVAIRARRMLEQAGILE